MNVSMIYSELGIMTNFILSSLFEFNIDQEDEYIFFAIIALVFSMMALLILSSFTMLV